MDLCCLQETRWKTGGVRRIEGKHYRYKFSGLETTRVQEEVCTWCVIGGGVVGEGFGVQIVAVDFNQANLKSVLPKFYQHVSCATRGENTSCSHKH